MNSRPNQFDRLVLIAAIAIFIVLHIYHINEPPNGYHQWRESDTAAIILNYYQEDANFLHQRCNQRGIHSGITAGELPTYSYSSVILYFIFGPHHFLPRLLTLAGSLLGLYFFRNSVALLSNPTAANYSTIALAFSPIFLFYSFKIMPDIWMLMFMLGAVYFFLKYVNSNSRADFFLSAVFLILSATIKPLSLCIYLPFLFYLKSKTGRMRLSIRTMAVYGAVTFSVVLGWFLYGLHLNSIHHSDAFYMGQHLIRSHIYATEAFFYKMLFLQWPFELWIGWAMLPVFIYGCIKFWKEQHSRFFFIWILAGYIVFALVSSHARAHDYYTLVIVPPLAAISGWGLYRLSLLPKWRVPLVTFIVLVLPAVSSYRIKSRFDQVPFFDDIRLAAGEKLPPGKLVLVEDKSTPIRLYQLNRHGWPVRDSLCIESVCPFIDSGGVYLVLDNLIQTYNSDIWPLVKDSVFRIGPLYGYKVIRPD
ncbi:MAG TPA: glycosyltransferase family 39 protein [candidate division Zixibacteria bacterium]|nr:glycosyltransferase family 39 protein [candidate division Zixibacteria bacterium]